MCSDGLLFAMDELISDPTLGRSYLMRISIWSAEGIGTLQRHDVTERQGLNLAFHSIESYIRSFPVDDFCMASANWWQSELRWAAGVQLRGAIKSALRVSISGDGPAEYSAYPNVLSKLVEKCRSIGVPAVAASQFHFSPSEVPLLALVEDGDKVGLPYAIGEPLELIRAIALLENYHLSRSQLLTAPRVGFSLSRTSLKATSVEQVAAFEKEFSELKNRAEAWLEDDERFPDGNMATLLQWHWTAFAGRYEDQVFIDRTLVAALAARLGAAGLLEKTELSADLYERVQTTGIGSSRLAEILRDLVSGEFVEYSCCAAGQLDHLARVWRSRGSLDL